MDSYIMITTRKMYVDMSLIYRMVFAVTLTLSGAVRAAGTQMDYVYYIV